MNTNTNTNDPTKPLTPHGLASQLFEAVLVQCKGDAREASIQVIRFLTEALVFSISVSVDTEVARKGMLKQVADSIATAPQHPLATVQSSSKP